MTLFHNLKYEHTVQVNDKFRFDASGCYASSPDTLTTIELEPFTGAGYITLPSTKVLDFQYLTDAAKVISLRLNGTSVLTYSVSCLSVANDNLFSNDDDLMTHEPMIMNFMPDGKTSYLVQHRRSQTRIVDAVAKKGIVDSTGNKLTKAAFVDILEVKEWSTFLTLAAIFEGISNAVDDIFQDKAKRYSKMAIEASDRAYLTLDKDASGTLSASEKQNDFKVINLFRR
jgi:hypothetical protein